MVGRLVETWRPVPEKNFGERKKSSFEDAELDVSLVGVFTFFERGSGEGLWGREVLD